jgi:cyclic beta-1,2-glucan synthetase
VDSRRLQILFWLFPFVPTRSGLKRNSLPIIGRWKILDNLRRSLVAPTLLALLVAGWIVLPGSPWFWTMTVVGIVASQLLPLFARLVAGPRKAQSHPVFFSNLRHDAATALAQAVLSVTFMAYQAFETVHAIGLTLVRLVVTKRRLLEWETAAATAARTTGLVGRKGVSRFIVDMASSPTIAALVAVAVVARRASALPVAAPFLLLWATAPVIAYWLSVPAGPRVRALTERGRGLLRRTARKTWRYFETFVTEADAWLPPDNYQEEGNEPRVARRTSPTNIGMSLLSALAAHDLGYLSTEALVKRLDLTLTSLEGLERYHGHFLNWYDTSTTAPLHPRYVSTVDSGNLAASLMALAQGLVRLTEEPQTPAQLLEGLADAADLLARASASTRGDNAAARQAMTEVNRRAREILAGARSALSGGETARLEILAGELLDASGAITRLAPADAATDDVAFWCRAVADGVIAVRTMRGVPHERLEALARRASTLADSMQFDFLYDPRRRIFSIGYRLADADGPGRLDQSFYDLLASEARLASFVAIAKGDVPQHHWFHLGRLVTNVHGRATLMSWGGTMFEYLMPLLLMRSFPGTLLDQSCRSSVRRQIEYATRRGVRWGISESAYAFTDRDGNYSTARSGVPGLGLSGAWRRPRGRRRMPPRWPASRVPPPPRRTWSGLNPRRALTGGLGSTNRSTTARARAPKPTRPSSDVAGWGIVQAFFAHHQGMSLVALANRRALTDVFVKRFTPIPGCRRRSCCCRSGFRGRRFSRRRDRPRALTATPSLPVFASLRPPSAAQDRQPAFAFPVQRPLHNGADARRAAASASGAGWRSPGSGRTASRMPVRISSICATRGRVMCGRPRISRVPESPMSTTSLSISTRSRSAEKRRLRDAGAGDVSPGRRRRGAAPVVTNRGDRPARDRGHQLRRDRARASGGRPGAPRVCEAVHRDRVRRAEHRAVVQTAPARAEETPAWAFHVLGVDGRLGGAVEWETDRARFSAAGDRSPTRRRSTAARCPARPAPCSIPWRRCANACGWRRAPSCA